MKNFNIAYIGFLILLIIEYYPIEEYNFDFGVGIWILLSCITIINSSGFRVLIDMCMEEVEKQEKAKIDDKKDINSQR